MQILSEMVPVPAGEFDMGQEDGRDEERPVHRVSVGAFELCRFQVTNADYDLFRHATGREAGEHRHQAGFDCPRHPVVAVNWFDATAFCEWLSSQSGRHFRLPTEAEWEWAARGGLAGRKYPWGDHDPKTRPGYGSRWLHGPELVGTGAPNGFGLFDMCENVHEWCSDWYDANYYAVSPTGDPQGPQHGVRKSSRGGAWRHHIKVARCAARSSILPVFRYADYGFRVACDR